MVDELLLGHAASTELLTSSPACSALPDPSHLHQENLQRGSRGCLPGLSCCEMCNRVKADFAGMALEWKLPVCSVTGGLTHYISLCESKYFFCQNACNTIHSHSLLGVEAKA